MRIAVVAPTHIPARRANTVQVMKMSAAMVALGHEVRLAAPLEAGQANVPDGTPDSAIDLARHYGLQQPVRVEWLPAGRRGRRYDYAYHAVRWGRAWHADLLYTRLPQAAALASQSGMPVILESHDFPQGRMGPLMFRLFLHGRGARRLVVITRTLASDLTNRLGAPAGPPFMVIAPDGVDLVRYTNLPAPAEARRALLAEWQPEGEASPCPALSPDVFTAGYTGHLYAGRGEDLLLSLAARLPEVTFLLAGGDAQDLARLHAEARTRHLTNLILTGFIPNADLPRYQAACDVLLMPYQRRVAASSGGDIARYLSPMKLFEYLACGRPILSSDLPVLREVLSAENAVLLPPDEVEAWAAALLDLQHHPAQRAALAAQARQTATRYTWEKRAALVLDFK